MSASDLLVTWRLRVLIRLLMSAVVLILLPLSRGWTRWRLMCVRLTLLFPTVVCRLKAGPNSLFGGILAIITRTRILRCVTCRTTVVVENLPFSGSLRLWLRVVLLL